MKKTQEKELLELMRSQELRAQRQQDLREDIKKWLIWIIVGGVLIFVFSSSKSSDDGDFEEAPDYCDRALCK